MTRKLEEVATELVGTPFLPHGRTLAGLDCWGLVIHAYREVRGVALPDYGGAYTDDDVRGVSRGLAAHVRESTNEWLQRRRDERPAPMDVVVFLLGGHPVHVGLMVDHRHVLHCEARVGTVLERLNSSAWAGRVEGVYFRG